MRPPGPLSILPIALAALAALGMGTAAAQTVGSVRVQARSVVRIAPPRFPREPGEAKWKERKAAKCQPLRSVAAALGTGDRHMDVLLRDGTRMRARFAKGCRGQDFYAGFYAEPAADGLLCAGRDTVRARSGMSCRIERFRRLAIAD